MMREHVAGTDTREAMATKTVRASVAAAALAAGPGWAAAVAAPKAWHDHLVMPTAAEPWFAAFLGFLAVATAVFAWRQGPVTKPVPVSPEHPYRFPPGVLPAAVTAIIAVMAAAQGQTRPLAVLLPAVPVVCGWLVGQAARLAATASSREISSAAAGVVIAGALVGLLIAGHIGLVARGSGPNRAAGWSAVYLVLAVINFARARKSFARDLDLVTIRTASIAARDRAEPGSVFVLDDIHVSFRSNRVLTGASIETKPGELVALVGGNGAGKSTLLRVAAGLVTADRGRVIVGNNEVSTLLPEERAAAGLAFISGARPVFPDLTVTENLRVAAFRSHLTSRSFDEATEAVFELVPALERRRRSRAGVLSGGEQRLLAVAQMLYRRPTVLLADELSLGLDADSRVAVLDLLRVLADQGVSAVVVDHDLPTLLSRATRAVLLTGGGVENYDRPEELLQRRADLLPATFLAGANG